MRKLLALFAVTGALLLGTALPANATTPVCYVDNTAQSITCLDTGVKPADGTVFHAGGYPGGGAYATIYGGYAVITGTADRWTAVASPSYGYSACCGSPDYVTVGADTYSGVAGAAPAPPAPTPSPTASPTASPTPSPTAAATVAPAPSATDPLKTADDGMWSQLNAFLDDPIMALGFGLAATSIAIGLALRWVRKAAHA